MSDNNVLSIWDGKGDTQAKLPLSLRSAKLPDPSTIAPRPWLYGTQLVRGFVTVLVAPGGTGKSAYAMAVAAAMATGTKFLGEHVFERVNTAILNLEDPMEELDRRLAAIVIRHRIPRASLDGHYFMHSGEDRPVTMACLGTDGFTIVHPDEDALIAEINAHQIGLIVVDPFAESHSLEENSNPQMVQAVAAWRRVARATGCAILLVHHVRKGLVTDIDSARGAKALTDSARIGLLLSPMSPEDAEGFRIPETERHQYIRLDDAKANMAPKAGKARWFKLDRIDLGNGTAAYPNGDKVAAIVAWDPPAVFSDLPPADCNVVLDIIAAGFEPGVLYTATKQGGSGRWAGRILMERYDMKDKQASAVIAMWVKNGVLEAFDYVHPKWRRETSGLRVNDAKRPS